MPNARIVVVGVMVDAGTVMVVEEEEVVEAINAAIATLRAEAKITAKTALVAPAALG